VSDPGSIGIATAREPTVAFRALVDLDRNTPMADPRRRPDRSGDRPKNTTAVGQRAYVVTVNKMIRNPVVVRDYEQENLDFLTRESPHPSHSQPVIDIEYDVKQQLDKIYNEPQPKFKVFTPTETTARRRSRPSSAISGRSGRPVSAFSASSNSSLPPPVPIAPPSAPVDTTTSIDIDEPSNRGGADEEDDEDYGDDDYEEDDDFDSDTAASSALESNPEKQEYPKLGNDPIQNALEMITDALNAGKVDGEKVKEFLVAARGLRQLVRERDHSVSRVLAAVSALVEESGDIVRMVLIDGGMAVLALVVDATFQMDSAEHRLQLSALEIMLALANAFEIQSQETLIRDIEMDFVARTLVNVFRVIPGPSESVLTECQQTASRVLRALAGTGCAKAIARLHDGDHGFDGMRFLMEALERPSDKGPLQCLVSSCVLSLIVHDKANAAYVNRYNGPNGTSGTSVVASAIEAHANDSDVQSLAAPATQQLFRNASHSTHYGSKYEEDEHKRNDFTPLSANYDGNRQHSLSGKRSARTSKQSKNAIPAYTPGQWGAPSMETLTREYKEVVRTIAGIRHTDTKGRRDGRGLTADAMNAINRCEARKKYLLDQIRMLELDRTYRIRAKALKKRRNHSSMPALHTVTSPQNPYIPPGKKRGVKHPVPGSTSPSRGPIDSMMQAPPHLDTIQDDVRQRFKDRYNPPDDAQWFTGNFAKDVQKLKTKLGVDSGQSLRNNIKKSRGRANKMAPSLSKGTDAGPGLEPPSWNTANDRGDVEVAIALMDRKSTPGVSPYADVPLFVNWTEAHLKPVLDMPGLHIVPAQSPTRKTRPATATIDGKPRRRPRHVRPMTSIGVRSNVRNATLKSEKRPKSSPGNRKSDAQLMSRLAERREHGTTGLGRPQSSSSVRVSNGMRNTTSAPALRASRGILEGIDDPSVIIENSAQAIAPVGAIMVPNPAHYRPESAPASRKAKERGGKKKRNKKVKKQKKRPSTAQSNVGSIKAEPSKKYRRRQRQNKTFTTTVKRRAKTRLEKQEEEAAIKMQTIARGHMARKEVQQKKAEIKSSIQIQKVARARHARKEVAQKRNELDSAKKIQAVVRGREARMQVAQLKKEDKAARTIENVARGRRDRKRVAELRKERQASIQIQKVARAKQARKTVQMQRERVEQERKEVQASKKIQAVARGKQTRARVQQIRERQTNSRDAAGTTEAAQNATDSGEAAATEKWTKYYQEGDGTPYWYNNVTGASQWSDPLLSPPRGEDIQNVISDDGGDGVSEHGDRVEVMEHYDVAQHKNDSKQQSEGTPGIHSIDSAPAPLLQPPTYSEGELNANSTSLVLPPSSMDATAEEPPPLPVTAEPTSEAAGTRPLFKVGQAVSARAKSWSSSYPGVIAAVNEDGTYHVSFDDGDYQEYLLTEHIEAMHAQSSPHAHERSPEPCSFQIGQYVTATCADWVEWYPGRVTDYNASTQQYSILFDDGDSRSGITESDIKTQSLEGEDASTLQRDIEVETNKLKEELSQLDASYQYDDDFDEEYDFDEEDAAVEKISAGNNLVGAGSGDKVPVEKDGGNTTTKWFSPDDNDESSSSASASENDALNDDF
jgi:hypothetical protein